MLQAILASKRSYHVGIVMASLPLVNLAGTQTPPLLILEPVLFLIHNIFECFEKRKGEPIDQKKGSTPNIQKGARKETSPSP